uniref:Phasin family protein n=1 Tax=Candidatus Kentrum sp. DK TaxID=2126562 RepID=A0A450SNJ0_9GAMM|nr:MAG: phasin family protein [Candidatus Kentron sp. DK]
MATQSDGNNPFDITKMMPELDPNKMMEQFSKIIHDYKIPGIDSSAIIESSRKNVEALISANRQAVEGLQAVATRQGEMLREMANEAASTVKQISSGENPTEVMTKQMELIKPALEKVLTNAREIAEMLQQSNTETLEIMKKRFEESLSELKSLAQQAKK